jgi:hypothetical protein
MRWSDFLNFNKKCQHTNLPLDVEIGYCPDCGELVENHWYITRCGCCGVKERATVRNGEVVPEEGFCHNCGSKSYKVEEIEKIDCININYAIVVREIVETKIDECVQSWLDVMQTCSYTQKLLK